MKYADAFIGFEQAAASADNDASLSKPVRPAPFKDAP